MCATNPKIDNLMKKRTFKEVLEPVHYIVKPQCIDYAVESCSFPFAFELCKHESSAHKLPEIYLKHAMYLEDEG